VTGRSCRLQWRLPVSFCACDVFIVCVRVLTLPIFAFGCVCCRLLRVCVVCWRRAPTRPSAMCWGPCWQHCWCH
jgi:hypothetical protein